MFVFLTGRKKGKGSSEGSSAPHAQAGGSQAQLAASGKGRQAKSCGSVGEAGSPCSPSADPCLLEPCSPPPPQQRTGLQGAKTEL